MEDFNTKYADATPEQKVKRYMFLATDLQKLTQSHHESEEGRFELDRYVREAMKELEDLAAEARKKKE
jgi:hypothetical protein